MHRVVLSREGYIYGSGGPPQRERAIPCTFDDLVASGLNFTRARATTSTATLSRQRSTDFFLCCVHQVLHDNGSSLRVVLDRCVKTGGTCSLSLRYQLRVPPETALCVEHADTVPKSTSALEISFRPSMSCVRLDQGGEDCGGSRRELRQVLSITCAAAFSSPPEIALTTSDRPLATTRVPLQAVTVAAFMTGLSINADDFRRTWTTLSCSEQAILGGEEARRPQQVKGKPRKSETAAVKRLLVETLGMREVVQQRPPGAVVNVDLLAAAGELLLTSSTETAGGGGGENKEPPAAIVCLVGVELHTTTGAARVTTKSTESVLAESVQKEVLEGIHQIHLGVVTRGKGVWEEEAPLSASGG